jgi:hypothetical protein
MLRIPLLTILLICPAFSYADSYKDSHKHKDAASEKIERGYWKKEDCTKVSAAAGALLYASGELLKNSNMARENGNGKKADKLLKSAFSLSEISVNFAENFETFCRK